MFREFNDLRLFFENPTKEYHLRQLARAMKNDPVTVKRHLAGFVKIGILFRKKERNLELYSANPENFYYKEYKKVYNKFMLFESGLIDFIKHEFNLPTMILFGSYAFGEDNKNSDIDIFILSEIKKDVKLGEYEKILGKPIQLHIMNRDMWTKAKKNSPELVNSIINGSVLYGFLEVL